MTKEFEAPSIIRFPVDRIDATYYECSLPSRVVMFWFNTMDGLAEGMFEDDSPEKFSLELLRDQFQSALDPDSNNYLNPGINGEEIEVMRLIMQNKRERMGARLGYKDMIKDMMREVESSFNISKRKYVNRKNW